MWEDLVLIVLLFIVIGLATWETAKERHAMHERKRHHHGQSLPR